MNMHSGDTMVLTVDDNPLIGEAAAQWFTAEGMRHAGHFLSGEGVIEAVQQDDIRVVVMDLDIPGTDTCSLVEQILEACSDCRVIMLSGHLRGDAINECLSAGASGYISKFRDSAYIRDAVRKVAAGDSVLCDEAARAAGLV